MTHLNTIPYPKKNQNKSNYLNCKFIFLEPKEIVFPEYHPNSIQSFPMYNNFLNKYYFIMYMKHSSFFILFIQKNNIMLIMCQEDSQKICDNNYSNFKEFILKKSKNLINSKITNSSFFSFHPFHFKLLSHSHSETIEI